MGQLACTVYGSARVLRRGGLLTGEGVNRFGPITSYPRWSGKVRFQFPAVGGFREKSAILSMRQIM